MNNVLVLLKGLIVGSTMLVPGVSGGSMAMILGIYDELIHSVNSFFKKKSMITLFLFAIGGIIGIILFSRPLLFVIEMYKKESMFFFIGAIFASAYFIFKEVKIKKIKIIHIFDIFIGALIVYVIGLIPIISFDMNIIFMIFCGFVLSVALILPGISVSYVLLVFGIYEEVMKSINQGDIITLLPLIIGGISGLFLTSSLLEKCLNLYPTRSYMIILGFVFASVMTIFPGFPDMSQLLSCVLTFISGFLLIYLIQNIGGEC